MIYVWNNAMFHLKTYSHSFQAIWSIHLQLQHFVEIQEFFKIQEKLIQEFKDMVRIVTIGKVT